MNIEKSLNSKYELSSDDDDEKDQFPPAAEGGVARVWALRGFPR